MALPTVRTTTGRRSRIPGTLIGVQLNTFRMRRLEASLNGQQLAPILLDAAGIAFDQAVSEWPVLTGASRDSISLDVIEVESNRARVALQAGGPKLINDARNKSGKDYAPFIEFNGTATAPPGILIGAIFDNEDEIKQRIRAGVADLIRSV